MSADGRRRAGFGVRGSVRFPEAPHLRFVIRSQDDWSALALSVREVRPATLVVQVAVDDTRLPDAVYAELRACVTGEVAFVGVRAEGDAPAHRRLELRMLCTEDGEPRQRFDRLRIIHQPKREGG